MLNTKKDELITIANTFLSKGMLKRGGKVLDIQIQSTPNKTESKSLFPPGFLYKQEDWITLVIEIAVGEAMGANIATTVAEGLAPFVEDIFSGKAAVKIVSNYSIDVTTSSFSIPIDRLDYKGVSGRDLATRIVQANSWACDDPMRAGK
jgi:hydroxymethylglutaryl-CoA reductase